MKVRRLILVVALIGLFGGLSASPALALSCSTGQEVWIKTNTSVDVWHSWSGGTNAWGSGGYHTTDTNQRSTWTSVGSHGQFYYVNVWCVPTGAN